MILISMVQPFMQERVQAFSAVVATKIIKDFYET